MRLIAAAVQPNPLIEHLLESYRPFGRRIEHRTRISNRGDQAAPLRRRSCARRWSRCSTVRPAGC
jgi:hypothetical protein